jgi:hypothetical protein
MQYLFQLVCILADNCLCTSEHVSTFFDAFSLNTDYIVLGPFREMLSFRTQREYIFNVTGYTNLISLIPLFIFIYILFIYIDVID